MPGSEWGHNETTRPAMLAAPSQPMGGPSPLRTDKPVYFSSVSGPGDALPLRADTGARLKLSSAGVLCGRYELADEIGRGAAATVFAAWDRVERKKVAVKVLDRYEGGEVAFARF